MKERSNRKSQRISRYLHLEYGLRLSLVFHNKSPKTCFGDKIPQCQKNQMLRLMPMKGQYCINILATYLMNDRKETNPKILGSQIFGIKHPCAIVKLAEDETSLLLCKIRDFGSQLLQDTYRNPYFAPWKCFITSTRSEPFLKNA